MSQVYSHTVNVIFFEKATKCFLNCPNRSSHSDFTEFFGFGSPQEEDLSRSAIDTSHSRHSMTKFLNFP